MAYEELDRLVRYLESEIHFFRELEKYESLKSDVIVKQDVDGLRDLTKMEEGVLERIENAEKERENIVRHLFDKYDIKTKKILTNLLNQLPETAGDYREVISRKKEELVGCIRDLKNLNSMNNKLLKDSISFITYTLNSIRGSDTVIYNSKGDMPADYKNSWVVNRHA